MLWQLLVGGVDVSQLLLEGASFSEIASSSDGQALFSLNGAVPSAVVGASVLLNDGSGNPFWEGTVTTATPQVNRQGIIVATLIVGSPLASQTAVTTSTTSSTNNDISAIAQNLAGQTPLPWGGSPDLGIVVGGLTFTRVDNAFAILALLANAQWRVQNGAIIFVGNAGDQISIPAALVGSNQPHSQVSVAGGIDQGSRVPLSLSMATYALSGSPVDGPLGNATHPEIADQYTLQLLTSNYAQIYGTNFTGTATFSGVTVRAGDAVVDTNDNVGIAQSVTHQLTTGTIQSTVQTGAPLLSPTPTYSSVVSDSASRLPAARMQSDYVVTGGAITYTGLIASIAQVTIVLANTPYTLSGNTVTLPENGTTYIVATDEGFIEQSTPPLPGVGTALYLVTTVDGDVVGSVDSRTHGGVGNYNLKPATPGTPSVILNSIALTAEGATNCVAATDFTVDGVTLDDTIASIDVVWSIAGANNWNLPTVAVWSPGSQTVTAYIHGLSAGQGYDLAVWIRGRNGETMTVNPLILGTSPTISASAIAIAIAQWNTFGGTLQSDGSITNVDGSSSSVQYSLLDGQPFTASLDIASGGLTTGDSSSLILGNTTNGYVITWDGDASIYLYKIVSSTSTVLGSITGLTKDTNYHTLRLTVTPTSSGNQIQGTVAGVDPNNGSIITDSSLNLTSGTWPVTIQTGGSIGKIQNYIASAASQHIGNSAPAVQQGSVNGTFNPVPDSDNRWSTWTNTVNTGYTITTYVGDQYAPFPVNNLPAATYISGITSSDNTPGFSSSQSQLFPVYPGQTITASIFCYAGGVSGSIAYGIFDPVHGSIVVEGFIPIGSIGRFSITGQIPSGLTQAVFIVDTNNCTLNNGGGIWFGGPQIDYGPYMTAYNSNTFGHINNTLPYIGNSSQVQGIAQPTVGTDSSYAAPNIISNRHIQGVSLSSSQVAPSVFSTWNTNVLCGSADWADASNTGIAPGATLTNGASYYYNVGSMLYTGSSLPQQTQYYMPSGSLTSVVLYFQHQIFSSGSFGNITVYFTGSGSGGSTTFTSQSFSGGDTSYVIYNSQFTGNPVPGSSPGSYTITQGVTVSGSNPLTMVLSTVTTPSDAAGFSSLTVILKDSSNTTLKTVTGITTAQTITYNTSHAADTFTWTITAEATATPPDPYYFGSIDIRNYTCSWAGSLGYYITSPSTLCYVLAADGVTKRTNTADRNVQFVAQQLFPDSIAFTVYSNNASTTQSFSIGVQVSGL